VARLKDGPWSEDEVSFLRNSVRRTGLKKIAQALGRSETAIKLKAKRLGIRKLVTGDGYTMRSLERGLGVDHHQVERWIRHGWFAGERRESQRHGRQRGDIWYFTAEAIRELIRRHPEEVDRRRVDWTWFIEVLLGSPDAETDGGQDILPLPPRPGRSIYAYMSDEAHSLLVAHYTGAVMRTEALAQILGVSPDEIVTWAVLLGLERAEMHQPRIHQQPQGETPTRRTPHLTQYVRQMLEDRYTGDPGATEALADDLDLTVKEVEALARKGRIHALPAQRGDSVGRSTKMRRVKGEQGSSQPDGIPLHAQLLIATRYTDEWATHEQLAEELTSLLDASAKPISAQQVQVWAKRLGLRTKHMRPPTPASKQKRRNTGRTSSGVLHLEHNEWTRFLGAKAFETLHATIAKEELSTVEEIRLGYQSHVGMIERRKDSNEQDPSVIEAAKRAQSRFVEALLPLVGPHALQHLGQGVSLEHLLQAGQRGLDLAINAFDFASSRPLVSYALSAIDEEIMHVLEHTSLLPLVKGRRLYTLIVQESQRLTDTERQAPTVRAIAESLKLPEIRIEETIASFIQAKPIKDKQKLSKPKVSDEQIIAAFMKTRGQRSRAVIAELAEHLPLTLSAIQVKFYALGLRTRLSERPIPLLEGSSLWDVQVGGERQRWRLAVPYGELAPVVSEGVRISYKDHWYKVERVYHSTLIVSPLAYSGTNAQVDAHP